MMNRKIEWNRLGLGMLATAVITAGMLGCTKKEEEPAPVTRRAAPPPAPMAPPVTPVSDLMAQLGIDSRIDMTELAAPRTDDDRRALLEFFDAFARGDDEAIAGMVDDIDQMRLSEVVQQDNWNEAIENIDRIELRAGNGPLGKVVLAIFTVQGDLDPFQLQLWEYDAFGDDYSFRSVASPPDLINRLSGSDWIGAWYDLLDEEIMLADKLEEEVEFRRVVATSQSSQTPVNPGERGPSSAPNPNGPATPPPGDMPGRRIPTRRREAPGPG